MARDGGLFDNVLKQRLPMRWARAGFDHVAYRGEERLAQPCAETVPLPQAHNADWAWRPELWRGPLAIPDLTDVASSSQFGGEVAVFHNCTLSEICLRQVRNSRVEDRAAYGLQMDVFRFDGTFLSIVLNLPPQAISSLKRSHVFRMDAIVEVKTPIKIFSRLNIKHGPNTEQIVREVSPGDRDAIVEFDLAYTDLRERRIEKAWMDLIFSEPEKNAMGVRDLVFSRRPRAPF